MIKKYFERKKYDWHLSRMERINNILASNTYPMSGNTLDKLIALRQYHANAMFMRVFGKPVDKKGIDKT